MKKKYNSNIRIVPKLDISVIPNGCYCYDRNGVCPYWSIKKGLPEQENGYCKYLNKSDFQINEELGPTELYDIKTEESIVIPAHVIPISLLWDQVKECHLKENFCIICGDELDDSENSDDSDCCKKCKLLI